MNEYIRRLREWSAARHAEAAAIRAHNARPLDVKIRDWYAALPANERQPYYTMDELVLIFKTAPGRIGTALHFLGWQRRRRFSGGGSHARFWVPPR